MLPSWYVDTVCGFTVEYVDVIDYNYYTARCCTTYKYVFVYTCLLLLFVIVCRMAKFVPVVHCM